MANENEIQIDRVVVEDGIAQVRSAGEVSLAQLADSIKRLELASLELGIGNLFVHPAAIETAKQLRESGFVVLEWIPGQDRCYEE